MRLPLLPNRIVKDHQGREDTHEILCVASATRELLRPFGSSVADATPLISDHTFRGLKPTAKFMMPLRGNLWRYAAT